MEQTKIFTLYVLFTCDIILLLYGETESDIHYNRISKMHIEKLSEKRNSREVRHREKKNMYTRFVRETNKSRKEKNKFGQAIYFSGKREILKLRLKGKRDGNQIPRRQFALELWVKPEGGQTDPTSILGE